MNRDTRAYGGPCHRCGRIGHIASNCTAPMVCERCGQRGHTQKFCGRDQQKSSRPSGGGAGGSSELCHRCGRRGHYSRDCKFADNTCHTCGEAGHTTRECRGKGASVRAHRDARRHEKRLFHRERRSVALADSAKRQDREERAMRKELGDTGGAGEARPGGSIGVVPLGGVRVGVRPAGKRTAAAAAGGGGGKPVAKKAKEEAKEGGGGGESKDKGELDALGGLAGYGSDSEEESEEEGAATPAVQRGAGGGGAVGLPDPAMLLAEDFDVSSHQEYIGGHKDEKE